MSLVLPLPTVGGHNYLIHGIAGVFASWLFVWSPSGVFASVLFAAMTQAIDTIRLYRYEKKHINGAPEELRQELLDQFDRGSSAKFLQLYAVKIVWYSLVTLVAGSLARAAGF